MHAISAPERAKLAALINISEQYLYQCLRGVRDLDATQAARLEKKSSKRVRRWQLRRDWAETWPELVGKRGAPKVVKTKRG